jgi:hypothetical protein
MGDVVSGNSTKSELLLVSEMHVEQLPLHSIIACSSSSAATASVISDSATAELLTYYLVLFVLLVYQCIMDVLIISGLANFAIRKYHLSIIVNTMPLILILRPLLYTRRRMECSETTGCVILLCILSA